MNLLVLLVWLLPALAQQTSFDVKKSAETWSFDIKWKDADGAAHRARFSLPGDTVREDLEEPLRFKLGLAHKAVAAEVNAWAKDRPGPTVKATADKGGVRISAKGKHAKAVKKALAEAGDVRDAAMDRLVEQQGYTKLHGAIVPDHTRHITEYADDVAPVVTALGGPGEDPRSFADLALSFVQSIPYEKRARVSDRYRRPLSVLGRNKGDCDSKTVLFLALMRSAWPEVGSAVVYVEGHAFGALDLDPRRGDARVKVGGEKWLAVEPVGPALAVAGDIARSSKRKARWGRATTRKVKA